MTHFRSTDYAHIWLSNGDGTFTVKTFSPWNGYAIPNGLWLTGDFNGDGKTDIVHAVANTDYVHIWKSQGDGTLQVTTFSPWVGYAIPNGLWLTGDITGDSKTDIVHAVQNTNYVHPWLSIMPAPNQFSIDGLEVTQSIQDINESVALVANKQTWARAYVSVAGQNRVTVRGTLAVRRSPADPITSVPSANAVVIDPAQNGLLPPKRENISASLNFPLPAGLISPGSLTVRLSAVTDPASGAPLACSDCVANSTTVQLSDAAPMRLRIIGLAYTSGNPPTTFAPRALDFNLIQSWLPRTYPISQLIYSHVTIPWNVDPNNPPNNPNYGCGQANALVASVRNLDIAGGMDARTHYYGLVSDGARFMRGCAAGIPGNPDPTVVASGPTGTNTWGWDNDGSYGDWYTGHELGHTYGRLHPGSGCGESSDDPNYPFLNGQLSAADGAFTGLEVGASAFSINPAALPGVPWHDVMTYCQRQWLSSYTYAGILARLNAENTLPAGAPAPGPPGPGAAGMVKQTPFAKTVPTAAVAELELAKPAQAAPPRIVTGTKTLPAVRIGQAVPPQPPQPAMEKPVLPPTAALYQPPELPKPSLPAPPLVQRPIAPPSVSMQAERPVPVEPQVELRSGDFLNVVATVNLTRNTGKIQHVHRVSKALVPKTVAENRAQIRLTDASGKVLADYPVWLRRDTDIPPDEDQTALVDAVIPFVPAASAMELVVAGKVLDTLKVTKHDPIVKNVRVPPVTSRAALLKAPLVVTWEASHPDGAKMTYSVQISPDGGKTWQTLAVGLTNPRLEIDPEQIKDLRSIMFRVIASDGFHSAMTTGAASRIPPD